MSLIIMTDSNADLPLTFLQENHIPCPGVVVNFKGGEFFDDGGITVSHKDFYNAIKEGELPTTSQINSFRFVEEFKKHLDNGDSIIYLAFSSQLSGTYNSACIAKDELLETYPNADISVIDSKAASMGLGLMVYYAVKLRNEGNSKEQIVTWIENNKNKFAHFFTVNDLHHLKRGGRVSPTKAVIGTLLNIKPVLHVNEEGQLIPFETVKGRKKSLKALFDNFKKYAVTPENQVVFISHTDAEDDAKYVADLIRSEFNVQDIVINYIGPGVGSHTGVGCVALFFLCDSKKIK